MGRIAGFVARRERDVSPKGSFSAAMGGFATVRYSAGCAGKQNPRRVCHLAIKSGCGVDKGDRASDCSLKFLQAMVAVNLSCCLFDAALVTD